MAPADTITVVCSCGKRLKAPATSVGKKAKCPCGNILVISADGRTARSIAKAKTPSLPPKAPPMPAKSPKPVPVPVPEDDDGLSAMYELHQQAQAAVVAPIIACPQCHSPMEEGAILCTSCGYNTRTGRAVKAAAAAPLGYETPAKAAKKKKPIDRMAPTGSLAMGTIYSAVFAVLASLLWIGIAWVTGYEIGYIAMAIGAAAGIGMQAGHKGYSQHGGIIAACMTIGAIFLAKAVVLQLLLTKLFGMGSIFDLPGEILAAYFFRPFGLIFIAIGLGAAYRTASGSLSG